MRIPFLSRARRLVRAIQKRIAPGTLILLYHRIADADRDPWQNCVSPQHFAQHMAVLRRRNLAIPLSELRSRLRRGSPPRRAAVVTFDDGYADNLHAALPILQQYEIPATFFIATAYLGGEREFWWDELERLLLTPGTLPSTLHLSINGQEHTWSLDDAVHYEAAEARQHARWRCWKEEPPGPRQKLCLELWHLLHTLSEPDRRTVLKELRDWSNTSSDARPSHRPLTCEELSTLARHSAVEIGAHTATHPPLSTLSSAEQHAEIKDSYATIKHVLDCAPRSFSYPHGSYSPETPKLVAETGFSCACNSNRNTVTSDTSLFTFPRVVAPDIGKASFERWLASWI